MEKKTDYCVGKRTRSSTTQRVLSTHRQTSEMHLALSMRNMSMIKLIISKGEKLCSGVGINCFILAHSAYNRCLPYLLSVDPHAGIRAKNYDGLTLLMLYSKDHKLKEIQLMLGLEADVNDCSNDGSTALMFAMAKPYNPLPSTDDRPHVVLARQRAEEAWRVEGRRIMLFLGRRPPETYVLGASISYMHFRKNYQNIVDLLLQRGADVNFCKTDGENVLHIAVKNHYTFNLEMLQTLINAGVDPTTENRENCTVLSYAMKTFTELCSELNRDTIVNEVYPALRYIFGLAPFQRDTFQLSCCEKDHPQSILLAHLNVCQILTGNISIFTDLVSINKNLMNPELVVLNSSPRLNSDIEALHRIECIELPFGPLAHYLNYEFSKPGSFNNTPHTYDPMGNLQYLMSIGFTVNLQSYETLSPLTVGLLNTTLFSLRQDYETFARFMMNNGANVEQRFLIYREQDEELEQLSAALWLPDVLRVVIYQSHLELVKMFLPHFAHPPLALLPFARREVVSILFPFLSSYGPLHHSPLHKTVKNRIFNSSVLSEAELESFNNMDSSIPLLQELCRTAVRAHLAPLASQPINSLPELIKEIQPLAPGLRDVLLNVT